MSGRPHPARECPKCGWAYGFLNVYPKYEPQAFDARFGEENYAHLLHEERLRWECRNCGYIVYTKTADAT